MTSPLHVLGALVIAARIGASLPQSPTVVKFAKGRQGLLFQANLGDPGERPVALSTRVERSSGFEGSPAAGRDLRVSVHGLELGRLVKGKVRDDAGKREADAAIGLDLLGKLAVGVDLVRGELTFWPGGRLGAAEAKAWVADLPAWGDPSGVSEFALSSDGGAPTLEAEVSGKKARLLADLTLMGTALTPEAEPPGAVPIAEDEYLVARSLRLADEELPWPFYVRERKGFLSGGLSGDLLGALGPEAFTSRRVLYDFAGGKIYAERLSDDARLSLRLIAQTRVPLLVRGDRLTLEAPAGYPGFKERFGAVLGSEVLKVGDVPTQTLLAALRGAGDPALVARLIASTRKVFRLEIKTPSGEITTMNLRQR